MVLREHFFAEKDALLRPIQDKIYDEIQRYAEEKGYDFVDRSASTMVLFGSDRYNKSDDILKDLDILCPSKFLLPEK